MLLCSDLTRVRLFFLAQCPCWRDSPSVRSTQRVPIFGGTDNSELIPPGNFVGELGLVSGTKRLTSVECVSDSAVLYSLSKEAWESLSERKPRPRVARILDAVVIHYLSYRIQHVSNRIYETRCLPI